MSDQVAAFNGQIMTRREVEIAREAFDAGAKWMFCAGDPWGVGGTPETCRANARRSAARERFPMPKVTRPRIVIDKEGDAWRWTPEHRLQCRFRWQRPEQPEWSAVGGGDVNAAAREAVASVLANPTEEVEDDA